MERCSCAESIDQSRIRNIFALARHAGRPLMIFDTETSGFLNQPWSEILELAFLRIDDGHIEWDACLVRNSNPIPDETARINGITEEMCLGGIPWEDMDAAVEDFFSGCLVSGFNSREYDIPMLRKGRRDHGLAPGHRYDSLDVRDIHRDTSGQNRGKLGELCEKAGVPVINAHQAMADVLMTAYLLDWYVDNMGVAGVMRSMRPGNIDNRPSWAKPGMAGG